jgi:non-specific serine/threonine protein kinase
MIGNRILHYSIIEQIGEGGMGEVYLAEDERLHRRVALKFLRRSIREDAEARERLVREARAASGLSHPNIVSIHAIEETDEHIFIVMEYVRGESLHQLVKKGEVSIERALEVSRQVLSALAAAHEAGIVHRDIKSDNVIITEEGQAKVLDFGLARAGGAAGMTRSGSSLGTPAYMSPEQVQGLEIDQRSDLFSFGVVLYEMLAGRLPFTGEHESAVTYSIVNEDPDPIARHNPSVPAHLQGVVGRLLDKNRDARYTGAREVLADLHRPAKDPAAPGGRRSRPVARIAVAAVVVAALAAAATLVLRGGADRREPVVATDVAARKMLVVLPFENLGPTDQEYFADGITEEITTQLARLSGLGVISRTSAIQYKGSSRSLREIGDELGVQYALEGTVRWDQSGPQDRVRVSAQLIKVDDDTHLWADTYDRVYEQIFDLQSEVARNVAEALDVALLEPEREALAQRPTDNLDAYDYYLRGRDLFDTAKDMEEREKATEMIEMAVDLDSTFAMAQAMLARIYSNDYFARFTRDEERLEQARRAAEAALRHSPGQPYGHVAMGYYHYYAGRDYDRALEEFRLGEAQEHNNADLLEAMGYVQRRKGNWDAALELMKRAVALDPQSHDKRSSLIAIYLYMRRWADADRALADAPDDPKALDLVVFRALRLMLQPTDIGGARAVVERAREVTDHPSLIDFQANLDMAARDYETAIERISNVDGIDAWNAGVTKALAYYRMGRAEEAHRWFEFAAREAANELETDGDNHEVIGVRAIALAGAGRCEEAMREVQHASRIMPMSRDAVSGTDVIVNRSIVYMICGDEDRAIDDLEYLLSVPAFMTRSLLRVHPAWDELRDNPRFQRLIADTSS